MRQFTPKSDSGIASQTAGLELDIYLAWHEVFTAPTAIPACSAAGVRLALAACVRKLPGKAAAGAT